MKLLPPFIVSFLLASLIFPARAGEILLSAPLRTMPARDDRVTTPGRLRAALDRLRTRALPKLFRRPPVTPSAAPASSRIPNQPLILRHTPHSEYKPLIMTWTPRSDYKPLIMMKPPNGPAYIGPRDAAPPQPGIRLDIAPIPPVPRRE